MTILLENDVISSKWDALRQVNTFVVARDGKQWTVEIPQSLLQPLMGNKIARRQFTHNCIVKAMQGPPDAA